MAIDSPQAVASAPVPAVRGNMTVTLRGVKAVATGDLTLNNVIRMVKVPKGFVVSDVTLISTDLDTDGTPAITLSVGDGGATARYISASTAGQAGGLARATAGLGYQYTTDDTIDVLVAAAPDVAAAGTITVLVTGFAGDVSI